MKETPLDSYLKADDVDWDKWLQDFLNSWMEFNNESNAVTVIGDILDLTTYDDDATYVIAGKMLNTLEHIINGTTYDFIKSSPEANIEYLTMVNLSRIADYIDWGTSIRGAWLSHSGFIFYPDTSQNEINDIVYYIDNQKELINFWQAVIRFYKAIA